MRDEEMTEVELLRAELASVAGALEEIAKSVDTRPTNQAELEDEDALLRRAEEAVARARRVAGDA